MGASDDDGCPGETGWDREMGSRCGFRPGSQGERPGKGEAKGSVGERRGGQGRPGLRLGWGHDRSREPDLPG